MSLWKSIGKIFKSPIAQAILPTMLGSTNFAMKNPALTAGLLTGGLSGGFGSIVKNFIPQLLRFEQPAPLPEMQTFFPEVLAGAGAGAVSGLPGGWVGAGVGGAIGAVTAGIGQWTQGDRPWDAGPDDEEDEYDEYDEYGEYDDGYDDDEEEE